MGIGTLYMTSYKDCLLRYIVSCDNEVVAEELKKFCRYYSPEGKKINVILTPVGAHKYLLTFPNETHLNIIDIILSKLVRYYGVRVNK